MIKWEYTTIKVLDGSIVWMIDEIEVGGRINKQQNVLVSRLEKQGKRPDLASLFQNESFRKMGEDDDTSPEYLIGQPLPDFLGRMGKEGWEVVGMSPINVEFRYPKQRHAMMLVLKRQIDNQFDADYVENQVDVDYVGKEEELPF